MFSPGSVQLCMGLWAGGVVLSALFVLFGVFVPLTPAPLIGGAKQIRDSVASSRAENFKARHILFTRSYLCGCEDHSESSG